MKRSSHCKSGRVDSGAEHKRDIVSKVNRLLPKSLFAGSKTFFDKSKALSRRCQNSPSGLKQLTSLIFHFAKIYSQKTF
jgi:hypothetical protein